MKHHRTSGCVCDSVEVNHELLSVEAAIEVALELVKPVSGSVLAPISQALGRVSSKALHAPAAMPFFDNSAMDGYAISMSELKGDGPWNISIGPTIAAGNTPAKLSEINPAKIAIRILTGAPVPAGFDAVIPQGNCMAKNGFVSFKAKPAIGSNIRYAGSDTERGAVLVSPGVRLKARHIGLLAANGYGAINVRRLPKVAVFSTGDELIKPGEKINPGQIYDCNKLMLTALMAEMGVEIDDLGALPDNQSATRKLLERCRGDYDLILSTGSVSVGERDYLKPAFIEVGGFLRSWKVAVKPGKPVMFGKLGRAVFTGLPGNPLAAYVGFHLFVKPQLLRLCGLAETSQISRMAIADFNWRRKQGRTEVFPVNRTGETANGYSKISRLGNSVSATLFPLSSADGLALVSAECEEIKTGDMNQWHPFCN